MFNGIILGPLFIIIAAILWGVDGIVLRPALFALPVPLVVFIEHFFALLVMLPFFFRGRKELRNLNRSDWGAFFLVAIFGGALGTMFIVKALFYVNFVNLSIVVLIQKLQPVFALVLAAVILKEKLPKKFFFWAAVAIIAAYFVTFENFVPNFSTGNKTILAALFALGAAFAFGSSTVFSKRALQKVSFQMGTYLRFGLTSALMFFIALAFGSFGAASQITSRQFLIFVLIVFSSGGAAMFLYYFGLKRVTASVSTICELAFPLSAILLEFIIHGRMLSWSQWLGALVLFLAIYKVSVQSSGTNLMINKNQKASIGN